MSTNVRKKGVHLGARWESILTSQARRSGYLVCDVPDGCQVVGKNRLIRVVSPFDMILHSPKMQKSIFLDAKTTEGKTFPYSKVNPRQMVELGNSAAAGHKAGYLICFRLLNKVVWYSTTDFIRPSLNTKIAKRSVLPEDGIYLGTEMDFNIDLILNPNVNEVEKD